MLSMRPLRHILHVPYEAGSSASRVVGAQLQPLSRAPGLSHGVRGGLGLEQALGPFIGNLHFVAVAASGVGDIGNGVGALVPVFGC